MKNWPIKPILLGMTLIVVVSMLIGIYVTGQSSTTQEAIEIEQSVSPEVIKSYLAAHVETPGFGGAHILRIYNDGSRTK